MTQPGAPDIPLPFQLSRMITSLWVPQAIYAAAALGIADVLADGPRRSDDVAQAVGAHRGALHRLLRALVVLGLCTATDDGAFALTPLGACLRAGTRDSVRSWALLMGGAMVWGSWGHLVECVRTGEAVPKLLAGTGTFEQMAADPDASLVFDHAMVELTRQLAGAVAMAYDFSGIRTIVDVGGGYGALLPPILAAYPEMKGVVVDLARCRDGATRLFEKTGFAARCEFVACDIFESVPARGDAYIVKNVIHDWDDERSLAILRNCRAAMGEGSRLLVVEVIAPERVGSSPLDTMIAGADLNMLVNTGGLERAEAEYRRLIEAAGLHIARIVPTPAAMSVIEARPA